MPIYLPQLGRREFLKRVALAGAGALFAPAAFAEASAKAGDPDTLFFLSDTHIAADPKTISRQVNMADQLKAVVRETAAWPVRPGTVVVNGDLTLKEGLAEDYATFTGLLDPLRALAPVHLSLGNHDDREHFWSVLPADAAVAGRAALHRQVAVVETPKANLFLMDSLQLTNHTPGELGKGQLQWLAQELDARRDKPAIVVVHHNPATATEMVALLDAEALLGLLAAHKQVKAYVFGHTHDWHVEQHESGVHLINLPPTAYVFKEGRPSGWVRCTLAADGAEFELRSLDPKHPEHAQVKKLAWRV